VDALDQAARRGLFEVLGDRHQRHAPTTKQGADGDVVLHVARQAVDLVDHDRVDVCVLGEAGQHLLQLRPVRAPRRLAPIRVLVHQIPALVSDVADAGFALGGDGG
jgi:hypothetical protein